MKKTAFLQTELVKPKTKTTKIHEYLDDIIKKSLLFFQLEEMNTPIIEVDLIKSRRKNRNNLIKIDKKIQFTIKRTPKYMKQIKTDPFYLKQGNLANQ